MERSSSRIFKNNNSKTFKYFDHFKNELFITISVITFFALVLNTLSQILWGHQSKVSSILMYGAAMLFGPCYYLCSKNKRLKIISYILIIVAMAILKDLELLKRGLTTNVIIISTLSYIIAGNFLSKNSRFKISMAIFIIFIFINFLYIYRHTNNIDINSFNISLEDVIGKVYGQWISASYIFDSDLIDHPTGYLTIYRDIYFLFNYDENLDFTYYPILHDGKPWNSSNAIGIFIHDFGRTVGPLIFLLNLSGYFIFERYLYNSSGIFLFCIYVSLLFATLLTPIVGYFFTDIRLIIAAVLVKILFYIICDIMKTLQRRSQGSNVTRA